MAPTATLSKQQVRRQIPKDTFVLVSAAMDQGFQAMAGGTHLKLKNNDATIIVSRTPSDHRDLQNLRADITKAGVELPSTTKKARGAKKAATRRPLKAEREIEAPTPDTTGDLASDTPIHAEDTSSEPVRATELVEMLVMDKNPGEVFGPKQIFDELVGLNMDVSGATKNNVNVKLTSMAKQGLVKRPQRGLYQRVEIEAPKVETLPESEPVVVPESISTPERDAILENFAKVKEEVLKVDTIDPQYWYQWFSMCSSLDNMLKALHRVNNPDEDLSDGF